MSCTRRSVPISVSSPWPRSSGRRSGDRVPRPIRLQSIDDTRDVPGDHDSDYDRMSCTSRTDYGRTTAAVRRRSSVRGEHCYHHRSPADGRRPRRRPPRQTYADGRSATDLSSTRGWPTCRATRCASAAICHPAPPPRPAPHRHNHSCTQLARARAHTSTHARTHAFNLAAGPGTSFSWADNQPRVLENKNLLFMLLLHYNIPVSCRLVTIPEKHASSQQITKYFLNIISYDIIIISSMPA